jgi:hypothetical protein
MMRIEPGALPLSGLRSGKPKRAGGSLFDALLEPADTPPAETPAQPIATAALASLSPPDSGDSAPTAAATSDSTAEARGHDLLDTLTELQIALLDGGGTNPLLKLGKLVENLPQACQPALQAALDAIAQRAAIELARIGSAIT